MRRHLTTLSLISLLTLPVSAQDSVLVRLAPIEVEAARGVYSSDSAPASLALLLRPEAVRTMEPALSIENVLTELPGIWVADRAHLALGERLVVRGLGSRAAFGVRSVAVLLDGVLLTMPDGQAVLDPVEPAVLARAELLRGPSSVFWGNAAGGVLSLESAAPRAGRSGSVRLLAGSDGERQVLAQAAGGGTRQQTSAWASVLDREGFRAHSAGRMVRVGLRSTRHLPSGATVHAALAASDLDTESPGSLTLQQWQEDPASADQRYINTSSGKRATQVQGSLGLRAQAAGGTLSASAFAVQRSLDNPLPFAWVGVERLAGGLRADWRTDRDRLGVAVGADYRTQADDRINANNADGARGTDTDVDQRESVSGVGASAVVDFRLSDSATLTGGLRADRMRVELDDHLVGDGDESGQESFSAFSPSLGITVSNAGYTAYASFSTAFEIPTTTELVNSPDGSSGFNQTLEPQRVRGFEFGVRAAGARALVDVAVYLQRLGNFLSPYQIEAFPGRTFYRNVGEVSFGGVEVAGTLLMGSGITLDGTASAHRHEFASGALEGNRVPGIPMRFGSLRLQIERGPLLSSLRLRAAGAQAADDANGTEVEGFAVVDLRVGLAERILARARITPFVEVTNLLDTDYVISIVPNAFGGRYFEGSPGRSLRGGLAVSF